MGLLRIAIFKVIKRLGVYAKCNCLLVVTVAENTL
jgi:hypothetical protein